MDINNSTETIFELIMEYLEMEGGDDADVRADAIAKEQEDHAHGVNSSNVDLRDSPVVAAEHTRPEESTGLSSASDTMLNLAADVVMRKKGRSTVSDRASKRLSALPQGYRLSTPGFMIPPPPADGYDPLRPVLPPRPKQKPRLDPQKNG